MAAEWFVEVGKNSLFARMQEWEEGQCENAYQLGHDTVTYSWQRTDSGADGDADGDRWNYVLDLVKMTQHNEHTGTTRRILRLTPASHEKLSPFAQ